MSKSPPSRRLRRIVAGVAFVVGLVFLGTVGVGFVVNGRSRDATGTVLGVLLVAVAVHQWLRARR
ncbi:MAG TPA: hypothetical protein VMF57_11625 [Solirubrobacteraceae bacterium]|nr:hypothetical protein [Solirubrobacteraceae bacterium]